MEDSGAISLVDHIRKRASEHEGAVWSPADFTDLGSRAAVDKALQRLVAAGEMRRIGRGLYDVPRINPLTGAETKPDYRSVIRAVSRREGARTLVDGMTAANDLGLTTAVPAKIEVLTDARLRPITLGNQKIRFRTVAARHLLWADRPAGHLVQALHWARDLLRHPPDDIQLLFKVGNLLRSPETGPEIQKDLMQDWTSLPGWMQDFLRPMVRWPAQQGRRRRSGDAA